MIISKIFSLTAIPKIFSHSPRKPNGIYAVKDFIRVLERERARTERSEHRFSLVVFETGDTRHHVYKEKSQQLVDELTTRMRTTDEIGWLKESRVGAILHNASSRNALRFANNVHTALLGKGLQAPFRIYSFPPERKGSSSSGKTSEGEGKTAENIDENGHFSEYSIDQSLLLYAKRISLIKRCIDVIGSALGLILLSPLFIALAALIKVVSPGPAFYRQTRIGLGGRPFTMLKFRTMHVNADSDVHRDYLASLIHSEGDQQDGAPAMAKLDDKDNNIIPCGRLIRKAYLDELPQLINVLLGDMSLIGPRPAIPYEVSEYRLWHKGRLDVTPGMTGLWQVSGKNRLSFEQMVRLDIRYSRMQSFWLDLKILFNTPITIASEVIGNIGGIKGFLGIKTE